MQKIAIFTDIHGLLEPLEAVLSDIKKKGITEIYSLGDNICLGPNPREVMDLLIKNKVKMIAGNHCDYITLGIEPFKEYIDFTQEKSYLWTKNQLTDDQIKIINNMKHSYILNLGGKRIGLCHFANDCRIDFMENGVLNYTNNLKNGNSGFEQFLHTNSLAQMREIKTQLLRYGDTFRNQGIISSLKEPLFDGDKIDSLDAIIEGHAHFRLFEKNNKIKIYTLRGMAVAY